jgi:hypothetical protein
LDRRVDLSEAPAALLESNEVSRLGNESSKRANAARNSTQGGESHTLSQSASVLLRGADGVVTTIFAVTLLFISAGFTMLMIVAMLVSLLCGLACYS